MHITKKLVDLHVRETLTFMSFHVCAQITGKCKLFIAQLTGMWFILREMNQKKQTYNQQNNVILGVSVIYRFVLERFVQTVKGTRWYLV